MSASLLVDKPRKVGLFTGLVQSDKGSDSGVRLMDLLEQTKKELWQSMSGQVTAKS